MITDISNELQDLFAQYLKDSDILAATALAKISATITKKRVALNMNQTAFAKHMGVSQSMVSKWESGNYNFTIETIAEICSKLRCGFDIEIKDHKSDYKSLCDYHISWGEITTHGLNDNHSVLPFAS